MDTVKVKRGSGSLETMMSKAKKEGHNVILIDGERVASECLVSTTVFKDGKAVQKEPTLKTSLLQPKTKVFLVNMHRSHPVVREALDVLSKEMTADSTVTQILFE